MAFEDYEAELGILLGQINEGTGDRQELYETLREKLNEMRAYGMPITRGPGRPGKGTGGPALRRGDRDGELSAGPERGFMGEKPGPVWPAPAAFN